MIKTDSKFLLCLSTFTVLGLSTLLPAQFKVEHPSIGACTRKDEFQTRQEKTDELVLALVKAPSDTKATAALVKAAARDLECLIRYRVPAMRPVFEQLLTSKEPWFTRARAAYALKMLEDLDAVPALTKATADPDIRVRESVVATLVHLLGEKALQTLSEFAEKEKDPYVQATLASASAKPYVPRNGVVFEESMVGPEDAPRVEWAFTVKGAVSFSDFDATRIEIPVARTFVFPIQGYKEDLLGGYPRNSFGGKDGSHAGEDCAWFREGAGVYAIADGVVRMIQGAGGDWGFLVAIEHLLDDGRYMTSVYGHLGHDIRVEPGQIVSVGQRIGTLGLSCSLENGGYGAHLHFGLGDGPYRRPRGLAVGDQVNMKDADGQMTKVPVVRLVYADKENARGWPLTAFVVKRPDGTLLTVDVQEQQPQHELSWFQAYVKGCRGWLNPQTLLPELVK